MRKIKTEIHNDGFTGIYYPAAKETDKAFIVMFGDTNSGFLIKSAVKWLHTQRCNVLSICSVQHSGDSKGYHNFPLEYIEAATKWLFAQSNKKVGIIGGSTTGMLSLIAASYISDISLVVAGTPCDFVMQGFYRGKKEGMKEWPAKNQSTVSYCGEAIPYQPFYLDEHEYWETYQNGCKEHNEIYFLNVIRHSENTQPIPEKAFIKVENIKGKIVMFAAEDDTLWDAAKYCRRIEQRLKDKGFSYPVECLVYKYGTHFVFPEGMMRTYLKVGSGLLTRMFNSGKQHPKECREARLDVERVMIKTIQEW